MLPLADGLLAALEGVVLCVSGEAFERPEREALRCAVEAAGGRYSAALDASCTHLVTTGEGGAKNEALLGLAEELPAVLRVGPAWLRDSLQHGCIQDEARYPPPGPRRASTGIRPLAAASEAQVNRPSEAAAPLLVKPPGPPPLQDVAAPRPAPAALPPPRSDG